MTELTNTDNEESHKKDNTNTVSKVQSVFLIICVLALIIILILGFKNIFSQKSTLQKTEINLPAEVDLYKILPTNCKDCFDVELAVNFFKQNTGAKIIKTNIIKTNTDEAKDFIKKYKLARLPALVFKGEISKINVTPFVRVDDALVFDQTPPPYLDSTGKLRGVVTATLIEDSKCADCFNLRILIAQMRQLGVFMINKTIDYNSEEGKNLVEKYHIKKVPSLVLSKDAAEYPLIINAWVKAGTKESDGAFVLRLMNPPYRDVQTKKIQNAPSITFITDSSCNECYNVSLHKNLLSSNFGMTFADEHYVDVSSKEGVRLLSKYKIQYLPTILISKEAKEYAGFSEVWKQVGEVMNDGSFMFTKLNLLNGMVYKDIKTQKMITASENTTVIAKDMNT